MEPMQHRRAKWFMWRSIALAALLWLGMGAGGTPEQAQTGEGGTNGGASAATRKRTAAYVFDRPGLTLRDSDAKNLDQLNFSFALIQNGEASGSHWSSISSYKAFIERNPHILPVLSIGGWGADGFSQAASTADGRMRLVDSTLILMEKHGFLGLDIDWEYPGSSAAGIKSSANDRENFTLLLQAFREGLDRLTAQDGRERLLAIAVGAVPSLTANIDCAAVGNIVDQVNLMTYDLQTANVASHHTALYSGNDSYPHSTDNAVNAYVRAGIPRGKIMIGAAFYGRIFTLADETATPVFASAVDSGAKTLSYNNLRDYLASATVAFDEAAKAPYATDGKSFATYDDPTSIRHKGAYVTQNGLMGMMCWEYGGDSSGELLAAMHDSLN